MELGARGGLRAADLPILSAELGGDHELVAAIAAACGLRTLPDDGATTTSTMSGDPFASARAAMVEISELVAATANLAGRTLLPEESLQLAATLSRARGHLARLEANLGLQAGQSPPPSRLKVER